MYKFHEKFVPLHQKTEKEISEKKRFKDNKRLRKDINMKKLLKKWLKSEAYNEYCLNMARMYNFRAAN